MTSTTSTESLPRPDVRVKVPFWIVKKEGLASNEMEGEVLRVTAKGVQIKAVAVLEASSHCRRCGLAITHPVSLHVGFGPDCSAHLGIPRDFDEARLEEIREAARIRSVVTTWLPLRFVEVLRGTLTPATAKAPAPAAPSSNGDAPPPTDADETSGTIDEDAAPIEREVVTIRRHGDRLMIYSPFAMKDAIKADLPGRRWDGKAPAGPGRQKPGAWTVPASLAATENVAALVERCGYRLAVDGDGAQALVDGMASTGASTAAKTAEEGTLEPPPVKDGDDLHWHHQLRAFHFARERDAFGLFMGMGTGKSRVVTDLHADLVLNAPDFLGRSLIIAPPKALGVWPREFRKHSPLANVNVVAPRRKPRRGLRLRGAKMSMAERAEAIRAALAYEDGRAGDPIVVVVNYEAAWQEPLASLLLSVEWDQGILDESHKIKAPGGKWSLFCSRLRKVCRRRGLLTGTPNPHSPLDIYGQYRFADPGVFGTSFAAMRNRYSVMGGYGGHEIIAYKVAPTLPKGGPNPYYDARLAQEYADKMYSIAIHVADDVLDLPVPVWSTVETTLSPKAQATYDALEADLYAEIGDGSITAANALTKILRLQQTTSGWIPLDEDPASIEKEREWIEIDHAKRDLLADVLDDLPVDEPIVVACRFTRDLDNVRLVAEEQGRRYGEISGRRDDGLDEDACMTTAADVVGVQIQAGGVGIDLTRAAYAVHYSVGYSLGDWDQWLKRTHRPGQTRQVRYINLVCEGTKDEEVFSALRARRTLVEFVQTLVQPG